jgi:hypothetical protein
MMVIRNGVRGHALRQVVVTGALEEYLPSKIFRRREPSCVGKVGKSGKVRFRSLDITDRPELGYHESISLAIRDTSPSPTTVPPYRQSSVASQKA